MKIKKGFSLIEIAIVLIIIGVMFIMYAFIAGKQITEGKLIATMKSADNLVSKVCPEYVKSQMVDYDQNLTIPIPSNFPKPIIWDSNAKLEYQNGICVLKFKIPYTHIPVLSLKSSLNTKTEGDYTDIEMSYPLNLGKMFYSNRTEYLLSKGKIYPGTFADYWKINNNQYTNYGTLQQYIVKSLGRNVNRISSNNRDKADYDSLSYAGKPIPNDMTIIH